MKRPATLLFAVAGVVALLAGAWILFSPPSQLERSERANTADVSGSGILDGMTFSGVMGMGAEGGEVKDTFVFAAGTFLSTECDRRCGYPARPYFVRQVGEKIEFVSESQCLFKDAKITWRGTVEDGTIKGISTWVVKRWYWTIEKEILFEDTLSAAAGPVASN